MGARHCTAPSWGAIGVNYAKTWFTGAFPEVWLFALGGLFVLVTLLCRVASSAFGVAGGRIIIECRAGAVPA